MKKTLLIAITLVLAQITVSAQMRADAYYHTDEMPNAVNYLPPPPDSVNAAFAYDMSQYFWGKSIRDTERGAMAIADADCGIKHLCEIFSEPFGLELSEENTPAIYLMLSNAISTANKGSSKCKNYYKRVRPFQLYNEPVASGETLSQTSYPSGHTLRGWVMALLLVEINGDNQDAVLQRGYEFGQSRVIVGAHWQSDVNAGRVVGGACFARLHNSPEFRAEMAAAQAEYYEITGKTPDESLMPYTTDSEDEE